MEMLQWYFLLLIEKNKMRCLASRKLLLLYVKEGIIYKLTNVEKAAATKA
jgi:hypothetical protein